MGQYFLCDADNMIYKQFSTEELNNGSNFIQDVKVQIYAWCNEVMFGQSSWCVGYYQSDKPHYHISNSNASKDIPENGWTYKR